MIEIVYKHPVSDEFVYKETINLKTVSTVRLDEKNKRITFEFINSRTLDLSNHELVNANVEDIYKRAKVLMKV